MKSSRYYKDNIKIQETSQQICNSEKDSLIYFMRQCIQILNNLNIKCTSCDVKEIIINENTDQQQNCV